MPPERTGVAFHENWERHKAIMRDLYVNDNKSLDEVKDELKSKYGFVASKTQYEKKFKSWDIRKNLSVDEWAYVLNRKRKREDINKLSEVTLFGKVIATSKIKKAESRFSISELHIIHHTSQIRTTPPGISVHTPPEELLQHIIEEPLLPQTTPETPEHLLVRIHDPNHDYTNTKRPRARIDLNSDAMHVHKVTGRFASKGSAPVEKRDLPFIEFLNFFDSLNLNDDPSPFFPEECLHSTSLDYPSPQLLAADARALFDCDSISSSNSSEDIIEHAPFTRSIYLTASFSKFFIDKTSFHRDGDSLEELKEHERKLRIRISDMPERSNGEKAKAVQILLGPPQPQSALFLLTTAVYLHSNSCQFYNQLSHTPPVMKWIVENIPLESMKSLLRVKLPSLEAFKYSLLLAGLGGGHLDLVKGLLEMDDRLREFLCGSTNLVQEIVAHCKLEIVKFLVQSVVHVRSYEIKECRSILANCKSVPVAQILVAAGADVSACQNTALRKAILRGNLDMIKFLICAGADTNTQSIEGDSLGTTSLMLAVSCNDIKLLLLLLERNLNIDDISEWCYYGDGDQISFRFDRGTALQAAAAAGRLEIVEILLNNGATINAPAHGSNGATALQTAVENVHIETVRLLLERGAEVDAPGTSSKYPRTALLAAVEMKSDVLIELLLHFKANPKIISFGLYGTTALEAARSLKLDQTLISRLETAARNVGNENLRTAGDRTHRYMRIQLLYAIEKADFARIKELVAGGVEVDLELIDKDDWRLIPSDFKLESWLGERRIPARSTIFHLAITSPKIHNSTIFEYLFQNLKDSNLLLSNTLLEPLLHTAVLWNQVAIIEFLLDIVAVDINHVTNMSFSFLDGPGGRSHSYIPDSHGFVDHTVLSIAAARGDMKMLQLLIAKGAKISYVYRTGPDEVQLALGSRHYHMARYLLDCGVDINRPMTPSSPPFAPHHTTLSFATQICKMEFIGYMLARGACVNYRPYATCQTALQAAVKSARLEIVELFLDHNADVNADAPTSPTDPHPRLPLIHESMTALQLAASRGDLKIAQLLLDRGAEINMAGRSSHNTTALEVAASKCQLDMVQLLINSGADSHLPLNKKFVRALQLAKGNPSSPNLGVITLLEHYRKEAMEQWNSLRILEMVSEDEIESDSEDEFDSDS